MTQRIFLTNGIEGMDTENIISDVQKEWARRINSKIETFMTKLLRSDKMNPPVVGKINKENLEKVGVEVRFKDEIPFITKFEVYQYGKYVGCFTIERMPVTVNN